MSRRAAAWLGLAVRDSVKRAFFPKAAYLQLKAIGNAGPDWTDRPLHDYSLDISAAHALLGDGVAQARLVNVDVDSSYGHWIELGGCYNSVGYYEMPGARIIYRQAGGGIHSFGIASRISWRGEWYVAHLGAVLRSAEEGVVDEPSSGPGVLAYSGTC